MNGGLNSGHDIHGYVNNNNYFNAFRQPPLSRPTSPPQVAPIYSPAPLPMPVMPQYPVQHYPTNMFASSMHSNYGSNLQNQVNFNNRNLNRKSLDRNQYTYHNNNNFQSKSTAYSTHLRTIIRPIYPGKCGLKPTQMNQARVQNLHYPASSTEFGEFFFLQFKVILN